MKPEICMCVCVREREKVVRYIRWVRSWVCAWVYVTNEGEVGEDTVCVCVSSVNVGWVLSFFFTPPAGRLWLAAHIKGSFLSLRSWETEPQACPGLHRPASGVSVKPRASATLPRDTANHSQRCSRSNEPSRLPSDRNRRCYDMHAARKQPRCNQPGRGGLGMRL